jgi:cell wall-associated NlpC family hydrolase
MVCWEDGRSGAGSVRWFYFRFDNGHEGFVPATRVYPQTTVNACSDTSTSNSLRTYRRGVAAARWALSRNNQVYVSRADQDRLASHGGVSSNWTEGDWSGDCSGFVFLAWDSIGIRINYQNARQMWDAYPTTRRHGDRNPPRGALVFWNAMSGGINYGHVEVSLGNSRSIGTTGFEAGPALANAIAPISDTNYLGWVMP